MSELVERAKVHDASKFEEPERSVFAANTPKLAKTEYGSPEYSEFQCSRQTAIRLEDFVNGYLDSIKTKILNGELSDKHTEK